MEVYSSLNKRELTKYICQTFNLKKRNINWQQKSLEYLLCYFYYKNIKVYVCKAKEQYRDIYTFEVNFMNERLGDKPNGIYSHSMSFSFIYAYFENKHFNKLVNNELVCEYLKKSKEFVDNNKLIFEQTDEKNQRRFIYIEGNKKEVSFGIDGDIKEQWKKDFGDKWQNIYNNRPEY